VFELSEEMQNTRQKPLGSEGSDAPTLQQLMATMRALQVTNEALRKTNEELRKTNKDLRKTLYQRDRCSTRKQGLNLSLRDRPKPFSQAIMDELVSPHYITPKIVFTGVEDPENHLTTFNAHMIVSEGTNVIQCKMFMSTFTGITLQ